MKRTGDQNRAKRYEKQETIPKYCVLAKKGDWAWLKQFAGLMGWMATGLLMNMCFVCGVIRLLECVWAKTTTVFSLKCAYQFQFYFYIAHSAYTFNCTTPLPLYAIMLDMCSHYTSLFYTIDICSHFAS